MKDIDDKADWQITTYEEKKAETPKAWLLRIHGTEYWIPKSQAQILDDEIIQMSPWIAKEKGLL